MEPIAHTTYPPFKPLMVYDGKCPFCRFWIARWHWLTGDRIDYAPFQEAADLFPDVDPQNFERSVYLITPGGSAYRGAHAVARALAYVPGLGAPLWIYRHVPGAARVADAVYGWVARHRAPLWAWTRRFWGPNPYPPRHGRTAGLYLRLLAVVYFIAFLSLAFQARGLFGAQGILPVNDFLHYLRIHLDLERYWFFPTLAWFNASDAFLIGLCALGMLASLLLMIGLAPALMALMLWLFYLSLAVAGQDFMNYQWDALLLEAGFLAIFLAPWRWRSRLDEEPPSAILWLHRWLLLRLIFSSGLVKVLGGDLAWRNLTALDFHFETQPLPTWFAWYFYQFPAWVHHSLTFLVLAIELGAPLFIFAPPRPRLAAFALLIVLQLFTMMTGNYAFFGLLTIALCVLLLNDAQLYSLWPRLRREWLLRLPRRPPRHALQRWAVGVVTVLVLLISTSLLAVQFAGPRAVPRPVLALANAALPLRSVNTYGLFALMTRSRPEIVIEGSADGVNWRPYEFKWKPDQPRERPAFISPHQPRLDWQMWFAAMDDYQNCPWVTRLLLQLLKGSPEVLALLRVNPFPEAPPRYVRAVLYDYHFTDWVAWRTGGQWWRRELVGPYTPVLTLPRRNIFLETRAPAGPALSSVHLA